ncbi:MAG: hypothetical protein PUC47_09645 [Oscillospiraceae bacterium]|nr:hypothetical protein [Oscillospiraceae bacterium]
MKMPKCPLKLSQDQLKLAASAAAVLTGLTALFTMLTASRLVWQLLRFLKEARKSLPVFRKAAELYIDERQNPPAKQEAPASPEEE